MGTYHHRQKGFLPLFFTPLVIGISILIFFRARAGDQPALITLLCVVVFLLVAAAMCFAWLEISDGGEELLVRFGPLPLFRKRLPYASIESVTETKSDFIDGWGIHFIPGRGTIWNVSGRQCLALDLRGGRRLRLGTDDPANLAAHLRWRAGLEQSE